MSRNDEVATLFEEFADLEEARGTDYKPSVYRRAAENIRDHTAPIENLAGEGEDALAEIDGVGDAIASKVAEYFETGEIAELGQLRSELPVDIQTLTAIEGVGPRTVGTLYESLGITGLEELETAAEDGQIQEVKGFGSKTEANIRENIEFAREAQQRERLGDARPVADDILGLLADADTVDAVETAGSMRRWRPTVGDIDILAGATDGAAAVDAFLSWSAIDAEIEAGETKASVRADGFRVDLRVVDASEFGAALQYFTGSKAHNVTVRNRALARDLKVNEYGVFDTEAVDDPDAGQRVGTRVAGQTEPDMYGAVGLSWIPPELREDNGEIQAAAEGTLPDLIEEGAIAGDLHTHTDWSDGGFTIEQMVQAAIDRDYEYHAVTDHAEGPGIFGDTGLSEADLTEQAAAIQDAADGLAIEVFHGVEANIAADGEVTTADEALADLDLVVASPHSALDQGRQDATDRLVRAIEHPEVNILGHPTGRLINSRSGLEVDIHELAAAAAKHDVAIEVNSNPARLDADGTMVRAAVEAGAPIVIDTDAHGPRQFDHVRYGIHTARRGWAESADVINTRSPEQLRSFLES
jgi:DNA polymerase IV (family X)